MRTTAIICALLITGTLSTSTAEAQTAARAPEPSNGPHKNAIVGSWVGTAGDGHTAINSFTSDGLMLGSVQGEVNVALVQTPIHGAWSQLGERRFAATAVGLGYDLQTGEYFGLVKIHLVLRVNAAGDRMTGTDRVEVFGPDGALLAAYPPGRVQFTRIEVEPVN